MLHYIKLFRLGLKKAFEAKGIALTVSVLSLFSNWIFAAEEATGSGAAATTASKPSPVEQFFPFIILGLIFYFLLIRPQQKKYKNQVNFLSQIKRGDEVLTSSGIFGRIEGLTDQFVILEIADDTRIRVLKSQISSFAQESNPSTTAQTKGR